MSKMRNIKRDDLSAWRDPFDGMDSDLSWFTSTLEIVDDDVILFGTSEPKEALEDGIWRRRYLREFEDAALNNPEKFLRRLSLVNGVQARNITKQYVTYLRVFRAHLRRRVGTKITPLFVNLAGSKDDLSRLPVNGASLTQAQEIALIERFEKRVVTNPSVGDAIGCFNSHILYLLGNRKRLNDVQKRVITSICTIARTRPLPMLRACDFVMRNLDEPEHIRNTLVICQNAQYRIMKRIMAVGKQKVDGLKFKDKPVIMFVGFSRPGVRFANQVIRSLQKEVTVLAPDIAGHGMATRPLTPLYQEFEKNDLVNFKPISVEKAAAAQKNGDVDLIITGCTVLGRSSNGKLTTVNNRSCIEVIREGRKRNTPLLVVSSVFKIWPDKFFENNLPRSLTAEVRTGRQNNDLLDASEIDWVVTEFGRHSPSELFKNPFTLPFFERECFDLHAVLRVASSTKRFLKIVNDKKRMGPKDNYRGEFVLRDEYRGKPHAEIHPEFIEFANHGNMPKHHAKAEQYYNKNLRRDDWYKDRQGRYIAIFRDEERDTIDEILADTAADVLAEARANWGERLFFYCKVERPDKPQARSASPLVPDN